MRVRLRPEGPLDLLVLKLSRGLIAEMAGHPTPSSRPDLQRQDRSISVPNSAVLFHDPHVLPRGDEPFERAGPLVLCEELLLRRPDCTPVLHRCHRTLLRGTFVVRTFL